MGLRADLGQVRKISPPPGFDLRIVQPVGSRYTDYATGPTVENKELFPFPPEDGTVSVPATSANIYFTS